MRPGRLLLPEQERGNASSSGQPRVALSYTITRAMMWTGEGSNKRFCAELYLPGCGGTETEPGGRHAPPIGGDVVNARGYGAC